MKNIRIGSFDRTYLYDHNPFSRLFPEWRVEAKVNSYGGHGEVEVTVLEVDDGKANPIVLRMAAPAAMEFARRVLDAADSTLVSQHQGDGETA